MRQASWLGPLPAPRPGPRGPLGAIALGGNRGPTLDHFAAALATLAARGLPPLAVSAAYQTRAERHFAVGVAAAYFNAVVLVRPRWPLARAWRLLQALERRAGGRAQADWAGRALDLDLLWWGERRPAAGPLRLPHPRLTARPFVLAPLAEVAGGVVVPGLGLPASALWARLAAPRRGLLGVRRRWWAGGPVG